MSLTSLPVEIIHHILESPALGYSDLAACCLACHQLWEIAAPMLYKNLDFRSCEGIEEIEEVRHMYVIKAIALNPRLGTFVQQFHNEPELWDSWYDRASMLMTDDLLIGAATNMISLQRATLKFSPLAAKIMRSLDTYHHLSELSLRVVDPLTDVWPLKITRLRRLSWTLPCPVNGEDESWFMKRLALVLKVAQATCPSLRSLDIDLGSQEVENPVVDSDLLTPYISDGHELAVAPVMQNLENFSVRGDILQSYDRKIQPLLRNFLRGSGESLVSLFISPAWLNEDNDVFASICKSLLHLKKLELHGRIRPGAIRHVDLFVPQLLKSIISSQIALDSFTLFDIHSPFSVEIGRILGLWTGLKYLRLGDEDNTDGLYGDDGCIDLESYKPEILAFIRELPPSIEHLCLNINGADLIMESSEDFDPICEIGLPAFCHLRRLNSLDIHACISNFDGGIGSTPEAAVHFRRLTYEENPALQVIALDKATDSVTGVNADKVKTIWQSRFQCVYQEDIPDITHVSIRLALGDDEGVFAGDDASEIWWDKTPEACHARNERTKAKNSPSSQFWQSEQEKVWPAKRETWNDYPLYQEMPSAY